MSQLQESGCSWRLHHLLCCQPMRVTVRVVRELRGELVAGGAKLWWKGSNRNVLWMLFCNWLVECMQRISQRRPCKWNITLRCICVRGHCVTKREHIEVFYSEAGDYRSCSFLLDMCNLEMGLTSSVFFFAWVVCVAAFTLCYWRIPKWV